MALEKEFPNNMVPLGDDIFKFECHSGVSCFTKCCRNVDMFLFPYDILRLKNALKIDSETFMRKYASLVKGDNPYFPSVMLKLNDDEKKSCPFLTQEGCSVYRDRPSACRTYPLERAVDRNPERGRAREFYFLTQHPYCKGHEENKQFTVSKWVRNQTIDRFNLMNDLWAEMDTVFSTNPWQGEGTGGPKQQIAFMVCYNIDSFRTFCEEKKVIKRFRLSKNLRRRIESDDEELLKFGFQWLQLFLTGKSSLIS